MPAMEIVRDYFGERFHFYRGDSTKLVPAFARNSSHSCDVLLVDGDHRFKGAFADIKSMRKLAKPGAVLLIDDLDGARLPSHTKAHRLISARTPAVTCPRVRRPRGTRASLGEGGARWHLGGYQPANLQHELNRRRQREPLHKARAETALELQGSLGLGGRALLGQVDGSSTRSCTGNLCTPAATRGRLQPDRRLGVLLVLPPLAGATRCRLHGGGRSPFACSWHDDRLRNGSEPRSNDSQNGAVFTALSLGSEASQ